MDDLDVESLISSCPGDVGLLDWVHYRLSQRISHLEQKLNEANEQIAGYNYLPGLIEKQQA